MIVTKILIVKFLYLILIIENVKSLKRVKRIVGGKNALKPPIDDPVVFVRLYSRDARVEGLRNTVTGLYSFLGIRFADPPIGNNRFLRPRYKRLQGDINATIYGPPCPQPISDNSNFIIGSEDCLLLNVFTPQMPDETTGLPVIVWIHGGGFRYGSASQYGGQPLADQSVIFVSIQYRLGTLGLLGDGTKEFSGNVALFDMGVALRWVNEYISFFGGDHKNVKIMGHGSGASSAMYLSMSKVSRDNINGVVAMSGSALSNYALDKEPVQSVHEIVEINNCPITNETEILRCMQEKDVEEIIRKDSQVQTERLTGRNMIKSMSGFLSYAPSVEEKDDKRSLPGFITENPSENLKKGNIRNIPLLTGMTKDETANFFNDPKDIEAIWNNVDNFLGSLKSALGLEGFLNINNLTGQILSPILPGIGSIGLSEYLKIPPNLSPENLLKKVTETTTDVFFNLPAYLTVQEWSKVSQSFLYRFEYVGKKSSGSSLLSGLPLVSKNRKENIVAHGDELGYIFDINDVFGRPMNETKIESKEDLEVRITFTKLIANFAQFTDTEKPKDSKLFTKFQSKGSPFIKIGATATLESDFRFCQLSLWGAKMESVNIKSCQNLAPGVVQLTGGLTNVLQLDKNRLPNHSNNIQQINTTSRAKPKSILGIL